jgi:hypothetical protein
VDPRFLEPEYPFEWGGVFQFAAGRHDIVLQDGPDPMMNLAVLSVQGASYEHLEEVQMEAVLTYSDEEHPVPPGGTIVPGKQLHQLILPDGEKRFSLDIETGGWYALFTEHHPDEFQMKVTGSQEIAPLLAKEYKPDHEHDEEVSSVGITTPGDLDSRKLNAWLRDLLMNKGTDIYRMKGVLSIKGEPNRFVFQGVHMLFDGRADRPWGEAERHNSLIFIGRNLDRQELNEGFRKCLV